jgi:hypothetical protein
MTNAPAPSDILRYSHVDLSVVEDVELRAIEHVYHIGAFASRVTLVSQQVRAINLAWALAALVTCPRFLYHRYESLLV